MQAEARTHPSTASTNEQAGRSVGPGVPGIVRRALVVFGSRYGNTRRLAEALARGLARVPGLEVDCRPIESLAAPDLAEFDVLAVGGPTEMFSASAGMKEFLDRVPPGALEGRLAFAFDTRLRSPLAGSAARYIERRLEKLGATLVHPVVHATVRGMTSEERARVGPIAPSRVRRAPGGASGDAGPTSRTVDLLASGAEASFEELGAELAAHLAAGVPTDPVRAGSS